MGDYEPIPGWFDFAHLYDQITTRASDGVIFVEVGAYLGRSTVYLASCIKRSGKNIRVYAVDLWNAWLPAHGRPQTPVPETDDVFRHFIRNVRHAGVEDVIYPLKMPSDQAAELFEDGTLDFVFLDAAADYPSVRLDLEAWFPKVKRRGALGGRNYLRAELAGVRRAADEFFHEQELPLQIHGSSFLVIKSSPRWLSASQRIYRRLTPAS